MVQEFGEPRGRGLVWNYSTGQQSRFEDQEPLFSKETPTVKAYSWQLRRPCLEYRYILHSLEVQRRDSLENCSQCYLRGSPTCYPLRSLSTIETPVLRKIMTVLVI